MLKLILSIFVGKLIFFLTRTLNFGGGFAAPGLYALKLCPNLISRLSSQIPTQVIITGTNGKTTTAAMLSHLYKFSGSKVIRNQTGSNLERGIASTLIKHSSIFGKISETAAIWEIDEAAFNSLALKLKPDLIVFLNVYRDQLDRYGEVDSIVKQWGKTLEQLPQSSDLLINADDASLEDLKKSAKGKVEFFSVKGGEIKGERSSKNYQKSRFTVLDITKKSLSGADFTFQFDSSKIPISLKVPGLYNIYNAAASLSAKFLTADLGDNEAKSLKDFSPSFGRFEQFETSGKTGTIFLIKNPVGATQVLETVIPEIDPSDSLFMALNDNFADGTDVSWIWDIDFEKVKSQNSKIKIIVSGTRAYDLALRLKYAGASGEKIQIIEDLEKAFETAVGQTKGQIFILPTYTALLSLQKILVKKGIKKHYWRE